MELRATGPRRVQEICSRVAHSLYLPRFRISRSRCHAWCQRRRGTWRHDRLRAEGTRCVQGWREDVWREGPVSWEIFRLLLNAWGWCSGLVLSSRLNGLVIVGSLPGMLRSCRDPMWLRMKDKTSGHRVLPHIGLMMLAWWEGMVWKPLYCIEDKCYLPRIHVWVTQGRICEGLLVILDHSPRSLLPILLESSSKSLSGALIMCWRIRQFKQVNGSTNCPHDGHVSGIKPLSCVVRK